MLHRLDVCTTGVLVLARNEAAARRFTADMTAHSIRKQYKVMLAHSRRPSPIAEGQHPVQPSSLICNARSQGLTSAHDQIGQGSQGFQKSLKPEDLQQSQGGRSDISGTVFTQC